MARGIAMINLFTTIRKIGNHLSSTSDNLTKFTETINRTVELQKESEELKKKNDVLLRETLAKPESDAVIFSKEEPRKELLKPRDVASPSKDDSLIKEHREIKLFIESRSIKHLIHFTQVENLEGILKNGLVNRKELEESNREFCENDQLRLDAKSDSISLSISFPNHLMFYKYRKQNEKTKGWVVLFLSTDILYTYNCYFCKHNAADSKISHADSNSLKGINALREMFSESNEKKRTRSEQKLEDCYPTDPQAEVLVLGNIPIKHIQVIGVANSDLEKELSKKLENWTSFNMLAKSQALHLCLTLI